MSAQALSYPKLPGHLSTVRAGNRVARWTERRSVLVAQRDLRLRWYARLTDLLVEGAAVSQARRNMARAVDTLNGRINECNDALDALRATDPLAFVRPRRQVRRK